ncbi:VWA domain-containing protein [Streptomyces sp. ST2-7A]|uniref:VWA domain-containing protein n=1 Tax=Streptomyces sp. ST2-7A TaxID=2907214 RepID=UPI001F32D83C|nr:VWA domain-containing protein [Streptomyces sp. ST2-7A]MCE7082178.1 VWA domain-containing protein [Streptomyces sp. ST2-7A]
MTIRRGRGSGRGSPGAGGGPGTRRGSRTVAGLLCTLALPWALAVPTGPDPMPVADPRPAGTAVEYVVAVDVSASLTPADLEAEKAAATRIALGDVSSASHVTVFGFAAAEDKGQSAVDPACPRTRLDASGREAIAACVAELRIRGAGEGTGTDFPSAIRQGVHELTEGTDPSVPRVLFLLTDGKMDVVDSENYGHPAHREAEGERQLEEELRKAAEQGVQIWPLGFGPEPDEAQLERIAAGGYQDGCVELPSARPRAARLSDAADVGPVLEEIFAAAHCLRHQEGPSERPPATMEIDISPLATVGSIVVDKGDPEVEITYLDPTGHEVPTIGTHGDSDFELAGASGTVEALRIVNPLPGTWRVRAEAPEGHRSLPVGLSVLWQGELRGAITMDPPSPRPGREVVVTMRLQTREGYGIDDPRDYAGLRVEGELTGDGFDPVELDLADDGETPDPVGGDGAFAGVVTVPESADGVLSATATLTVPGLNADTRTESGRVAPVSPTVTATLALTGERTHPGGVIGGTLSVRNTGDTPRTLRLSVTDVQAGLLTVTPAEIVVEPGEATRREVTLEVAPAPLFGDDLTGKGLRLEATVGVLDADDGDRVLDHHILSVPVTPEPGPWERYRGLLAGAGALLAVLVGAVVLLMRRRRTVRDPHGLVLRLLDGTGDVIGEHRITSRDGGWYGFDVVRSGGAPRIERRRDGRYAIRRDAAGSPVLRKRTDRARFPVPPGGGVPLGDGVNLTAEAGSRTSGGRRPDTRPAVPTGAATGRPGAPDPDL